MCPRADLAPGTVLVTGARGIIGTILSERLGGSFDIRGVDLPDDIAEPGTLARHMDGVHTVIHLARERAAPDARAETAARIYPSNVRIDANVFSAVVEAGARRLVLASSVHADDFRSPHAPRPLTVPGSYFPATPYGVYKLIEEEVGTVLAERFGFEFVALRLGGVTRDDSVKAGAGEGATWLSHDDLASAIRACLDAEPVAGRSTVFYAISGNENGIHDTTNPFGWVPKD